MGGLLPNGVVEVIKRLIYSLRYTVLKYSVGRRSLVLVSVVVVCGGLLVLGLLQRCGATPAQLIDFLKYALGLLVQLQGVHCP